ncbi:L-2-haloalkanoic acid dehalogenase, partial [Mesorhizobium sp. M00.F.Ca.ET.186.01.1.1]
AMYIGDHPDNDVRASRAVGMKAVWKRCSQYAAVAEAHVVIDDLAEISERVLPSFQAR